MRRQIRRKGNTISNRLSARTSGFLLRMDTERTDRMRKLFTSESVTEGHPDKVCDQISDAILDEMLRQDPAARVACECCATTGLVMIMGEITANGECNMEKIARQVIRDIGYNDPALGFDADSCAVITAVHGQSPDISQGVTATADHEQGAGDQGMMFGFACNETEEMTPMALALSQRLTRRMAQVRKDGTLPWMRPDGKAQVTVAYEDGVPVAVDAVVISTQHDETVSQQEIARAMREKVIDQVIPARLLHKDTRYYINPTGRFVLGGPAAKNLVAAGLCDRCQIAVSYAIGVARPVSLTVDTFGTGKLPEDVLARLVDKVFDMRPAAIIDRLDLRRPIYRATAAYGHFGRTDVDLPWERLDMVDALRAEAAAL